MKTFCRSMLQKCTLNSVKGNSIHLDHIEGKAVQVNRLRHLQCLVHRLNVTKSVLTKEIFLESSYSVQCLLNEDY